MHYYAQLKGTKVIGISELSELVNSPELVPLNSFDPTLLGKLYQDGVFIDDPPIPRYNSYSLSEFINALQEDELGVLLELVNQLPGTVTLTGGGFATKANHRTAKKIWEWWRAQNVVDFNDQRTVDAGTWLVNNTDEWTPARGILLKGTI